MDKGIEILFEKNQTIQPVEKIPIDPYADYDQNPRVALNRKIFYSSFLYYDMDKRITVNELTQIIIDVIRPYFYEDYIVVCENLIDKIFDIHGIEEFIFNKFSHKLRRSYSNYLYSETAKRIMKYKGCFQYQEPNNILLCDNVCYNFENQQFTNPSHNKYKINACYMGYESYTKMCEMTTEFERFLIRLTNDNKFLITRIWQMIGYILSPDHTPGVVFVLQGKYNSGIRILVKVIESFFDKEKISYLDCSQLGEDDCITELENKCLNITYDTAGEILPERAINVVNRVANKDCPVDVRVSRGKYRKMFGRCKFLFVVNDTIKIKKRNDEFISRIINIPINNSTLDATYIELYTNTLLKDDNIKSFILNTAIMKYNNLKMNFYRFENIDEIAVPVEVLSVEKAMDSKTRSVNSFVESWCEIVPEKECYTSDLYEAYKHFCQLSGRYCVENIAVFSRILNQLLKGKGVKKIKKRRTGGKTTLNGFTGFGLKS